MPVQPNDHAWLQPGATAYVRFGHLEGNDGWYECTLGEQEGGADLVEINRHAIEHGDTVDGRETRPRTDAAAETTSRR